MPLLINGVEIKAIPTIDSFVKSFPQFKESSDLLLKQDPKTVGPHQLLYVGQREVGGTSPGDDVISILGSEDATTCHIVVIRHTGSGAAALAHFDGCSIPEGLDSLISIVLGLTENAASGRLEVHLVGGFQDERENSKEVSDKVLEALCKSTYELNLITACITHFNTVHLNSVPFPVLYGIAFDVKSGELYRAKFPDKGPDMALRSARLYTGGKENLNIYDTHTRQLQIGPFHYRRFSDVELFLSLPDHAIRKYLSTSPEQEPESFVEGVRAALVQLRDFPQPLQTVFKGGKSRTYAKDKTSGMWVMQL